LKDPIPPRHFRRDISPQLEEIILHALERSPRDRFPRALEFRKALANPEAVVVTHRETHQHSTSRLAHWLWRLRAVSFGFSARAGEEMEKVKEPKP
jgi:hypothetical protein